MMSEPGSRRGRAHDAQAAREAILNAAEAVFAEHGFDGARIDAIATLAGYNKSLIFQYFDDKLGLYAEILKRADREMAELQAHMLTPLLADESVASDAQRFRTLLETMVQAVFDYFLGHPRFMRILLWEQAEGWRAYAKIASQLSTEDVDRFGALFRTARKAGLLRSDFHPVIQLTLLVQICQSYLAFLPLYQMLIPDEDVSSAAAVAGTREHVITLVVAGMIVDSPQTKP
ncbi:MAG: TetR/AcrR family transcriptional regulator [Ktedonobacteraceae bacterium]|nr:TetR/AcrR family transcriptional regulator [Ktedonobacteraceae bacterium]